MGFFNFFSGKSPEAYERKGDALTHDKAWGEAKLAYEAGLDKMSRQSPEDPAFAERLRQKINQTRESLARAHGQEAAALMDAGCMGEAHELLTLAVELTADPQLKADLAEKLTQASSRNRPVIQDYVEAFNAPSDEPQRDPAGEDAEDYFNLLLSALPEDIQHAYRSYGHHFRQGYLALNHGEFDQAIDCLNRAAEENPSPLSLVPLELATAYANLGQGGEAQAMLEQLVQHRPDTLPAYQLLCDIYWEQKHFDKAIDLLDTLPPELSRSMAAFQIRGETLLQAGRFEAAEAFFKELFEQYGWNESIAIGQARASEALGRNEQARDLYRTMIKQCSGCGSRVDPAIKRKYADLSMATGHYTSEVLEHYLELTRQDPANAIAYFQNISRIYSEQGNDEEAGRFNSIAEDLARKR